jgi:hypothetical protein
MNKLKHQGGWFWFYVIMAGLNLWHPNMLGLIFGGLCVYLAVQQWQD